MPKKTEAEKEPKVIEKIDFELYSDVVRIVHNPRSFAIDFGQVVPWHERELVYRARIYMSPEHFAAFVDVLKRNLEIFKTTFGKKKRS
jgi:hypothetical protein